MVDHSGKNKYMAEYTEKIDRAKVLVLSNCEGVTVEEMNLLRKNIRNVGDETRVVKNTLVSRIMKNHKHEAVCKHLSGMTLLTFGYSDPVAPVKVLFDFADKTKAFKFKCGLLGDKVLSVSDLEKLSKLPSREIILSQMLSVMQGPMRNFVSVVQGPIRKLAYALQAIKDKKASSEPQAA
ncbi:MAG: 50S ribosomal protein L10 [Candidatus Riflebacteria bacterium]|nr:50S ribosomal protein L10 [Candidatus Riflebacteria bacterium]